MKLKRSLQVALLGAVLVTRALAQTEADIAALLPKAQRGNAIAQYNLGLAYLNGKGVTADPIEAYVWLSLAHEGGFRGKALGVVAGGLDPTDFENARKRLIERRTALNLKLVAAPAKTETAEAEPTIPVVRTDAGAKPAPTPAASAPTPAQNSNLAQELATAAADKQQLSSELAKSWTETEDLKKQLTETQSTADFLTAEISKLHGERDTLTSKLNALASEVATLRTDRDNARALGVQAEAQKASFESSLKEVQSSAATDKKWLSDELTKSFQEVTALKTQLAAAAKTAAAAPASPTYPDLSGKVKELETSLASVTADATSAKQEATRLADERIEREKQLLALQQQSVESGAARTALQQEVENLRRAAATPTAPAYPDLREQVATLKSEAGQAQQQIAALTQAKAAAENKLARSPVAPAYPDLSSKVKELEANLSAITADATSAKQEATRLADERVEREKQLLALQQQATESGAARTALQQEVENLRRAAATPVAPTYPDLRGKVTELETALADVKAEATSAKQEARNLQRAATPAAPAYPDLREQVASLESRVATLKAEGSRARDQIATLTLAKVAAEKSLAQVPAAPTYPDLSGKVKELEVNLSALSTKATAVQQEATRLADDRIEREKQLLAVQQQSTELAAARDGLQQEVQNLRKAAATPAAPVAPSYPDQREQVSSLESQLATAKSEASQQTAALAQTKAALEKASSASPAAPAYPDLSGKVRELESSLAAQTEAAEKSRAALQALQASPAQPAAAAPAYPDLSDKVKELETSLAARATDAKAADELSQAKADAEQKLAAAEQSRNELAKQFDEFKRSALANQREILNRQAQITMLEAEKTALRQQSSADQTRLAELSSQLAASRRKAEEVYPTAPAYPDQRARVEQLEAELTKTNEQANGMIAVLNRSQQEAKAAAEQAEQLRATIRNLENKATATAPAYPDLREQVSNLEIQLEAARTLPKNYVSPTEFNDLKQELADTKQKLATTLKGYALLENERDTLATRPAAPAVADQSSRVRELEAQLAAKSAPAVPAYPDLRDKVASLEAALSAAKSSAPAYPDLREQVSNLEIQLDAARALPKDRISPKEFSDLKQELTETQEKLATTLKGYRLIEKERDELAAKPGQVGGTQSDVARLTEAYNALQRTNAQNERDLVLLRAQLPQTSGSSSSVAQLGTPVRVVPVPVATRVAPAPVTAPAPVVAAPVAPTVRRTHIVVAGDTLVKISQRYYGNATSWQPIYDANRELLGPKGTLKVGTELRIP